MDLENLSNRGSLLYKPNDNNPLIPGEGGSNSFEGVFDGYSSNSTYYACKIKIQSINRDDWFDISDPDFTISNN
jgi:hypothetical protein